MTKKIALILALVLTMACFAGCGGNTTETTVPPETTTAPALQAPEGTTEELMTKLYENVTVELSLVSTPVDLNEPYAVSAFTGGESAEGLVEMTASESMMGSQAYSVTITRCESAEKAAQLAQQMFDNIDTRKWICVEASEKQAAVCGDLVLFVMLDPEYGVTTDQIVDAFTTVCGFTDSVIK